jgi:DNA-directed RNA polymerase subunit M/transcription elongation factor TFIIS
MTDKFNKLLDNKISKDIILSINKFTQEYVDANDVPFMFDNVFQEKVDEIYNLLINKKSNYLLEALKKNKIDPKRIAFLRPDELNPDKYEKIIEKKELEESNKKNQATSSVFKCPKCKARKVQIIQKQTRSSDEPATDFIECKECGHVEVRND